MTFAPCSTRIGQLQLPQRRRRPRGQLLQQRFRHPVRPDAATGGCSPVRWSSGRQRCGARFRGGLPTTSRVVRRAQRCRQRRVCRRRRRSDRHIRWCGAPGSVEQPPARERHTVAQGSVTGVGNETTSTRTVVVRDDVAPTIDVASPAAAGGATPVLDASARTTTPASTSTDRHRRWPW